MTNSAGKGGRQRPHPPFAQPDPGRRTEPERTLEPAEGATDFVARAEARAREAEMAQSADLPSIDQFVDDLPLIDEFLVAPREIHDWSEASLYRAPSPRNERESSLSPRGTATVAVPETDDEGWAAADWQSYDWNTIAALGAPEPEAIEAHAAWSSTEWDSAARGLRDLADRSGSLPATEVAAALEEIARRIRSGELSLERFHGTPPEAAIAALFAALIRRRG